jgi:lactoylglutathione lyase
MKDGRMKYLWTTLNVENMEKSLDFYQNTLGLTLKRKFSPAPGMEFAFLGDGETEIELFCNEAVKDINPGDSLSIGFKIESTEKFSLFLKEKGIEIHSGPFQPGPSIRFFFVLDPDGYKIQLVEEM